jgi:hypothetical protein
MMKKDDESYTGGKKTTHTGSKTNDHSPVKSDAKFASNSAKKPQPVSAPSTKKTEHHNKPM